MSPNWMHTSFLRCHWPIQLMFVVDVIFRYVVAQIVTVVDIIVVVADFSAQWTKTTNFVKGPLRVCKGFVRIRKGFVRDL